MSVKPDTQIACNADPCPVWSYSTWSACSKTCGTGTQSRNVSCYLESRIVDDSQCSLNEKEPVTRSCSSPCPKWVAHSWSSCTKSCDGGQQTRLYRCELNGSKVPDSDCNSSLKPEITEECNTYECPSWSIG